MVSISLVSTFSVLLPCEFVGTRSPELCRCLELFSGCGWSGRVSVLDPSLHTMDGRQPTQHFVSTVCRTNECGLKIATTLNSGELIDKVQRIHICTCITYSTVA